MRVSWCMQHVYHHHTGIITAQSSSLHRHGYTIIITAPSSSLHHHHHCTIIIPALSSQHSHRCTIITTLSSQHYYHHSTVIAAPSSLHYHHHCTVIITVQSSLHGHHCTNIMALLPQHRHHRTVITAHSVIAAQQKLGVWVSPWLTLGELGSCVASVNTRTPVKLGSCAASVHNMRIKNHRMRVSWCMLHVCMKGTFAFVVAVIRQFGSFGSVERKDEPTMNDKQVYVPWVSTMSIRSNDRPCSGQYPVSLHVSVRQVAVNI